MLTGHLICLLLILLSFFVIHFHLIYIIYQPIPHTVLEHDPLRPSYTLDVGPNSLMRSSEILDLFSLLEIY